MRALVLFFVVDQASGTCFNCTVVLAYLCEAVFLTGRLWRQHSYIGVTTRVNVCCSMPKGCELLASCGAVLATMGVTAFACERVL